MKRYLRLPDARWVACTVVALAVALSLPPMRRLIEQSMVWHMVVQMPLLVLGGWLSMRAFSIPRLNQALAPWNRLGLTGLIAAQGVVAYWMLPLALDRAVVLPASDLLKALTLTASGAILEDSFRRAPPALQLFFVGYLVSMMAWLGIYFATIDLRLCNAYSLASQATAGTAFAGLGVALGAAWLACMVRPPKPGSSNVDRTADGLAAREAILPPTENLG